jgi:hypothetical protein
MKTTQAEFKTDAKKRAKNNLKERKKNRAHTPPTQQWCQDHYAYDPETGALTRKVRMGRYEAGALVGKFDVHGFRVTKIDGRTYTLARIIWLMVTGRLPTKYVNFRDGDRTNLRASNLSMVHPVGTTHTRKEKQ